MTTKSGLDLAPCLQLLPEIILASPFACGVSAYQTHRTCWLSVEQRKGACKRRQACLQPTSLWHPLTSSFSLESLPSCFATRAALQSFKACQHRVGRVSKHNSSNVVQAMRNLPSAPPCEVALDDVSSNNQFKFTMPVGSNKQFVAGRPSAGKYLLFGCNLAA
jgi:hypothetical protein